MSKAKNVEATESEKKVSINAVVSPEFKTAFENFAEDNDWSVSTALQYLAKKAVGLNPAPPSNEDTTERHILSTAIEASVKDAIDQVALYPNAKGEQVVNVAAWLREIAANACGYDLSAEPARVRGGKLADLIKRETVKSNTKSSVLLGLRKFMSPADYLIAIEDAGATLEDIGLTADDVTEEAFAALR